MKTSAGAVVSPVYGNDGVAYLSMCEAHREGSRVFDDKGLARQHAQDHNDAHHHGQAPRFRTFEAGDRFWPAEP